LHTFESKGLLEALSSLHRLKGKHIIVQPSSPNPNKLQHH